VKANQSTINATTLQLQVQVQVQGRISTKALESNTTK
jgi:hypothetical protein